MTAELLVGIGFGDSTLEFAAAEDVILFACGAIRAAHATHEQDGYAHRYQDCQQGAIRCNPVQEALHFA